MADASTSISFPLLQLVSDARSTYGLRHQDYARYRSHCVAKVHHLRKSVGLSQTQGKSRKYQKKAVEADKVTSDKHLQIVLFDAERSWAHSQLLKSALDDPSSPSATKHHLTQRLAKASAHASALVALVDSPALVPRLSAAHVAQVHAYALVQRGTAAFERGRHAEGLGALSTAYAVLGRLAATAPSATDEALANEVMDDVEPMLRFCAYRLGRDTASGVGAVAREVAAQEMAALVPGWDELSARLGAEGAAEKRETVEIRWRGQVVPVRNAELVGPALKVQEVLASLREDEARSKKGGERAQGKKKAEAGGAKKETLGARRMGTYDKALLVLSDAEAVGHQLVEDNQIAARKGNTARSEAAARPLSLFHAYVQYHLLSVRLKRDLLLIASSESKLAVREAKIRAAEAAFVAQTGARDPSVAEGKVRRVRAKALPGLVRVFDTALLSLEAMRDLEAVEMDDELSTTVEARIALVRAKRCQYLSQAYALAPALGSATATAPAALTSAYGAALALNARAKLYVREARRAAGTLAALAAFGGERDDQDDDADDERAGTGGGGGAHEGDLVAPALPLVEAAFAALERALAADEARLAREWFDASGGAAAAGGELSVDGLSLDTDPAKSEGEGEGEGEERREPKVPFYDVAFNYVAAFDMDAIAARAGLGGGPTTMTTTSAGAPDAMDEVARAVAAEGEGEGAAAGAHGDETLDKPAKRGWGFGLFGRR
ncbi:hypothetical protein JCM3770_000901 [Rhodotorula araucariae]